MISMDILSQIVAVFWLFLPAGFANMSMFLSRKINVLNMPISKKLIGAHKTYRGLVFGVGAAIVVVYLQIILSNYINPNYLIIDYGSVNLLLMGFLLGFGAVLGDLVKSFFKRKRGIKPGQAWPPWDEIDFSIGAVLFLSMYIVIDYYLMILAVISFGLISLTGSYIAYLLGLRKKSEVL